jgi:hypothetical protein
MQTFGKQKLCFRNSHRRVRSNQSFGPIFNSKRGKSRSVEGLVDIINQDPTDTKGAAHHAATFLPRQPTAHNMPYRDPSNQAFVKDTTDHGKPSIHAEMSTIKDSLRPSQIMQSNHIK